jgi:hypothetical protein
MQEARREHFQLTRAEGGRHGHPLQPRQSGTPPPRPGPTAEPRARTTAAPSPLQDRLCSLSLDNRKSDPSTARPRTAATTDYSSGGGGGWEEAGEGGEGEVT